MSKSNCIRSCRSVARDLGIATALLAAIALAPAHAAADDASTDPNATQTGATEQQEMGSGGASLSAPSEGQDVRASYQEKSGDPKASRIEPKGEDASTVHVMAPSDPDWNETHQGG